MGSAKARPIISNVTGSTDGDSAVAFTNPAGNASAGKPVNGLRRLLLPELTLAQAYDLTADEIAHNIHAHPTLSEAIKEAAHGIAGQMINF